MKQALLLAFLLLITACNSGKKSSVEKKHPANQVQLADNKDANWADSVIAYRQQARQGDGDAYLKLARCYHDGRGVERDYLTMLAMVANAAHYLSFPMEEFINSLPRHSEYRLLYEGMEAAEQEDDEAIYVRIVELETMESKEAELLRMIRAGFGYSPDSLAWLLYKNVKEESSVLAQSLASVGAMNAGDYQHAVKTLQRIVPRSPAVWLSLASLYASDTSVHNDSLANLCYAKADEYALLTLPQQKRLKSVNKE